MMKETNRQDNLLPDFVVVSRTLGIVGLLKDVRKRVPITEGGASSDSLLRAVLSQYENNMFDKDVHVGEDQRSIDYNYQKT